MRGREAGRAPAAEQNSLDGVGALADVQGPVAILGDRLGVGPGAEQQARAVGAGGRAGRVQRGAPARGQVHGGAAQQQQPQAGRVPAAGRDVQRRGELLLVAQRPQSCGGREVRETRPATVQRPALSLEAPDVRPPGRLVFPLKELRVPSLQDPRVWTGLPQAEVPGRPSGHRAMQTGSSRQPQPPAAAVLGSALYLQLGGLRGVSLVRSAADEGSGARAGLMATR